jgi:hypothetical protein
MIVLAMSTTVRLNFLFDHSFADPELARASQTCIIGEENAKSTAEASKKAKTGGQVLEKQAKVQ